MSATNLTFEEVDRHVQSSDLSAFQLGGRYHVSASTAANPADAIPNVCGVYHVVRPILAFVVTFPIPQKWKDAIKAFMGVLDTICPQ